MIVFNAVEEFLKELETDKDLIARKIVRLTNLYHYSPTTPFIRHLSVAATYKAASEIVQFKQYIGDLWNAERDEKTIERSRLLHQQITDECKQCGLEVRAGMYQEANGRKDRRV
jgi:hypothetical protein